MVKVLMTWEQGSGLGHMASMLPIAQSLKTKGHQVWLGLKDFSKTHKVFAGENFQFVACPAFSGCIKNHFLRAATFSHILHNVGFGDYEILRNLVSVWRSNFELLQPDLIITDHSPVAMLAARSLGINNVTLGTGFSCPGDSHPYPDWRPALKIDSDQLLADENFVLENANRLLNQNNAKPLEKLSDLYAQVEPLLITYPELDPFPQRGKQDYLGILPSMSGIEPKWPTTDKTRVFAYLRPLPSIEILLNILVQKELSTIIRMPGAPQQLRKKFPSLIWEENFVDLSIAASKADFCLGHGTHMMTAQWLLAGKPVLMIPPYLEQSLTAHRVVAIGAGLASSLKRPEHLLRTVDDMLLNRQRFQVAAEKFRQRHARQTPEASLDAAIAKICAILAREPAPATPGNS